MIRVYQQLMNKTRETLLIQLMDGPQKNGNLWLNRNQLKREMLEKKEWMRKFMDS
jgi:hypothetical protein